jgi:hypothetical protein
LLVHPIATNIALTTVVEYVGIKEPAEKYATFSAHPNPVKNILSIGSEDEVIKTDFYDIYGRMLKSCIPAMNQIDMSNFNNGIYLMKIYTRNGSGQKVIIKE